MRIFNKFLLVLPLFFLSCVFSTKDNGPYAPCVDMERFSGLWFEIARKPIFFQGTCSLCWTEYKVCVKNEVPLVLVKTLCVLPNGEIKKLCGAGKIYDPGYNRRLLLSFSLHERIGNLLAQYNYIIYYVNDSYSQAIIGSPNHKYLWILSKDPLLSEEDFQNLVAIAKSYEFKTDNLIKDTWNQNNFNKLFPCFN